MTPRERFNHDSCLGIMAPTPYLIIDGYNLLHAAGLARAKYAQGDLHRQRHKLLMMIAAGLSTEERQRSIVVFDAINAPPELEHEFEHDGIAVLFAEPGHEADDEIEQLIAQHSSARQLIVVSSDHRLQRAARIRRAASLDSEAFLTRLSRRGTTTESSDQSSKCRHDSAKTAPSPDSDVAYWLRQFGPIDVNTMAQEENADSGSMTVDPWQKTIDELQSKLDDPEHIDRWLDEPLGRD